MEDRCIVCGEIIPEGRQVCPNCEEEQRRQTDKRRTIKVTNKKEGETMNQIILIGNLTRDPETGNTESGVNWCRFTLAVRKKYRKEGQPDADFIRVTAWRALGDTCAKYLAKGRKVAVVGTPSVNAWIGNGGEARGQLEVTADDVEFCSSSGGSHGPSDEDAPPDRGAAQGQRDPESGYERVDPEDQPF